MKESFKILTIAAMLLVGAGLVALSFFKKEPHVRGSGVQMQAEAPVSESTGTEGSAPRGVETLAGQVVKPAPKPTGLNVKMQDLKDIAVLARTNYEEAMSTYDRHIEAIINDGAKDKAHIQLLVRATETLTTMDGGNEHYNHLIKLWERYPREYQRAVQDMALSKDRKAQLIETIESFADAAKNGNG